MIAIRTAPGAWQAQERLAAALRAASPFLLLAGVGIELALLAAYLPGTLDRFLHGPVADFHNLYQPARDRELPGLYSPFLVVILQPLAWMPEMAAYRAMFAINSASLVAVALIAAGSVRSWEARTVVALAPIALPQAHWALRLGHLTPVIVLIALLALLSLRARPGQAAALFALLSLKPQYLIAPVAYLISTGAWRGLAITAGLSAAMAVVGLAVIGPGSIGELTSRYLDWGPNSTDNLLPIQQSWMVSWPGVQISAGLEAHALLTLDLVLLSLGVAVCTWLRAAAWAHAATVALMMIPVTPYAQFYDGALVLAAIALLLRSEFSSLTKGALCGLLYAAAVATQSSVVFPVKDVLGPAHSHGFFWLAPAMVAATCVIALTAGRSEAKGGA
jgi:hypothetical protein